MESPPRVDALGELGVWMPSPKAIIKLTVDANITRRIKARHIFQSSPVGCYSRLISLSLLYSRAPATSKIHTTYIDEDGDVITISSDWELIEAFQQFDEPPRPLRVTCTVVERGEETVVVEEDENTPNDKVPIQGLLESVLTVLARAVMVLQGQINQPKMAVEAATARLAEEVESSETEKARTEEDQGEGKTKETAEATKVADKLIIDAIKVAKTKKKSSVAKRGITEHASEKNVVKKVEKETVVMSPNVVEQIEGFDPEFVHARHTCDGCLKAPIVGIRYHATNLPDYDLCEVCYGKYDGNEITFEIEECDRDKHKQPMWKKRSNRRFPFHRCKSHPGNNRSVPPPMNEADALNEAIRRSLADIEQAKLREVTEVKEFENANQEKQVEETKVAESKLEEKQIEEPKAAEHKTEEKPVEELNALDSKSEEEQIGEPKVVDSKLEEEQTGEPKVVDSKLEEKIVVKQKESESEEKQVEETQVMETTPVDIQESSVIENTVESKEIVQVAKEESELSMEEESTTEPEPNPLSPETLNQESKGETIVPSTSGPTSTSPDPTMTNLPTEIKTETENKIERVEEPSAEAVSAITNSVISDMTNQSIVTINAADEVDLTIPEEPEEDVIVASPEGAFVSEKDDTSSASSSSNDSDDWDIVEDEKKDDNTDVQVESDNMLAPAMQNLGSTMFMSDMSRSAEQLTVNQTDAATDAMTIPSVSSVPTISSGPNDVVVKRWENELEQLRELGVDDKTSVEALELLQAANLGVGSDERVTVTQVLEYLW
eukprot:CAMPEP_0172480386 /NCGR_PEP_ID=MMETSP1066-20121228/5489_1 /TAXON_ID=671091 /ORGANISM="Coscinodiscus wailesii, Strain CCMP2513" /LENGTH=777 /DNA_ID=CAMNT_0013241635 /DNA_START=349 /DNA_END=2679 /DNA_ORIENTATION=-